MNRNRSESAFETVESHVLANGYVSVDRDGFDRERGITAHISRGTAALDGLHAATERTIALLKERRAAPIAAAVTGQIEGEKGIA